MNMFLYTADVYTGEITARVEGVLEWIKKSEVYQIKVINARE